MSPEQRPNQLDFSVPYLLAGVCIFPLMRLVWRRGDPGWNLLPPPCLRQRPLLHYL